MALRSLQLIRVLHHVSGLRESSYPIRSYSNHASGVSNGLKFSFSLKSFSSNLYNGHNAFPRTSGKTLTVRSAMVAELTIFRNERRLATTQANAPAQARKMGAVKVSMSSPGFVYEPYAPREPISFWQRWFTRSGWRRTKDDIILELKSAYAIAKLRKTGYSKRQFYNEAVTMYREINTLMANGDKNSLRKAVTENMFSALKNEIKQRETVWSKVYWELVEPVVKVRTLRARLIGVDRNDLNKLFIQLTLEFLAKHKFEAYDSKGTVVAGDKDKEVLVRDIWVFEKSLFHSGAYWRLCGRISA
ncbi:39S ribosomal protein L45, mitochondrial-like isoform X2 [Neltuma alba]|uniref:39S ribosomal protein L45, mitochondrial-like isoform X2 n=1 Tax=Neltuma alba TaxID=207710 RepID=UPI0010A3FB2C|nr:39S ribosomal protein L45, mitochondrial-like isoform X2 [Prosopis alba]XP_028784492.1 39S ribosomal protein L45, mitochondrial-like isoform X2 [Prosopis alba]